MKYQIFYTDFARQDLKNIHRYISESLVEPEIAAKLTNKIMKEIRSLDEMPQRYKLYDDEPWHSRGMRTLPVNNYLIQLKRTMPWTSLSLTARNTTLTTVFTGTAMP